MRSRKSTRRAPLDTRRRTSGVAGHRLTAASLIERGADPRRIARASPLESMAAPTFIHLRVHSEFSIADGTLRITDAVAAAAADAMPALAITDLANAFGLVKFYKAARASGVK